MREDSTQLFTGAIHVPLTTAHWPTVRCIFCSPCRRRQKTASVSRIVPLSGEATNRAASAGHLVTSAAISVSWCNLSVDSGALGQLTGPGENHSPHPRLTHTHPNSLSCPAAPQIKSLLLRQQAGSFIASLGYKNQRVKWMFSPLRTGTEQKEGNDYSNSSKALISGAKWGQRRGQIGRGISGKVINFVSCPAAKILPL